MLEIKTATVARLATMNQLRETIIPAFINPPPCKRTLRKLFDKHGIPRIKSNPHCEKGGGTVFYLTSAVEKLFRSRLLPGRLKPVTRRSA